MDREQIEIRYLEILNQGGNPMDDADIRRAIADDPALEAELQGMGLMIDALADASLPEGSAAMDREPIDAITKAFEEGLQQGRRADKERPARRGVPAWIPSVAVAATITAFFAGAFLMGPGAIRTDSALDASMREMADMPQVNEPAEERLSEKPATDQMAARGGRGFEANEAGEDGGKDERYQTLSRDSKLAGRAIEGARPAAMDVVSSMEDASADPIVALQVENHALKQTVARSLLESGSPAQRMQGLEYTAAIEKPDDELINALSNTLRTDASVTVRLATAEALNRYGSLPTVRNTIIDALLSEKDPLVQLQLIDLLMDVRDAETLKALRSLEQSDETDALVRQRVEWALKESR
jgi:hypothetical protein